MIALDHVAFGARDRDAATEALQRLGFAPSPPSTCYWTVRGESRSADAVCCVFPHQYFDLITLDDEAWRAHLARSPVYGPGLAPTGIVVSGPSPSDAAADAESQPYAILRDLQVEPPVRIVHQFLGLRATGLPLGLVRDDDPERLRRLSPIEHPNGALEIATLHLRVPSVRDALEALALRPLSLPNANPVVLEKTRLHLHEDPEDPYLRDVQGLLPSSGRPALLAIELHVAAIEKAAEVLGANRVSLEGGSGRIAVHPEEGLGTGILFSEASPSRTDGTRGIL